MKRTIANIVAIAAIGGLIVVYYYYQGNKKSPSQDLSGHQATMPEAATDPVAPNQNSAATPLIAETQAGQEGVSSDMQWFYTRFGYSTWFDEAKFNVKTFTVAEYNNLIAAAGTGNESATIALKLTILKYLKTNPDDSEYETLKAKLLSKEFYLGIPRLELMIDALPDELMDNKEFVTEIVAKNGSFLKFASERLRTDKDIVFEAIARYPYAMEFASDKLKGDREFAEKVMDKNARALCYLSDELRSDKAFVERYISIDKKILRCLSDKLLADKPYVLELIAKKNIPLGIVKGNLSDDKDVALAVLKKNPEQYASASQRIQNDPNVLPIIRAYLLSTTSPVYAPLPEKLRGDREVIKKLLPQSCTPLESAAPEIKDDEEIVGINPNCIRFASQRLRGSTGDSESREGDE